MREPEKIRRRDKVNIEQRTEMLTTAYIHSYNLALKEVRNPNLAVQIATAVIMVIDLNMPRQQTINPLEFLFTQMAAKAQERTGKEGKEADDHDRTENEAD